MVGRPREDKTEKIREIAEKIAEGVYQPAVAKALEISPSTVQRAVRDMRAELVLAAGPRWGDAVKTSAVQVARAWLERRPPTNAEPTNASTPNIGEQ